ncbi:phage tail protein [Shewanella sp. SR44-4]|uniref:phage tail protein n=1 Tax=Shewanella sp. SR44-4 TaxID=2760935 RepID=UPI002175BC82|nr:phage tail protein [Shewanella sp. SR44-4]
MAQVITIAGERLFALKAQNNEQLDIDTFIFANVPGQDPNDTIDRNEGLPPVAQRVHQQIVQQVGRINDNVVVYSTVLDSVTGPFDFNWVGLYSSANQTLIAVSHIPNVSKTITVPGTAGNTLNRNFGIEYSGIADLAGITVQPETWQLDFTARLSGMDELTRQLAADMNGKDWFIGDGFKVVPRSTTNTFKVTPGAGYVSGLRVELKQDHILTLQSYPQFVYVDAWFDGDASSKWAPKTAFTVTNGEMDDYIDVNGKQHYVFKLARITAADVVEDLRVGSALDEKINSTTEELSNVKEEQAINSSDIQTLNAGLSQNQETVLKNLFAGGNEDLVNKLSRLVGRRGMYVNSTSENEFYVGFGMGKDSVYGKWVVEYRFWKNSDGLTLSRGIYSGIENEAAISATATLDGNFVTTPNIPEYSYTTEIGAKFTATFTGKKLIFKYRSENRGGIWRVRLSDGQTKDISTFSETTKITEKLIFDNLDLDTYKVEFEFIGANSLNPPAGGESPRGWLYYESGNAAAQPLKFALTGPILGSTRKAIGSPNSIPDFAIAAKPAIASYSTEWVPQHSNVTGVSKNVAIKIITDGIEKLSDGNYDFNRIGFFEIESIQLLQKFEAENPNGSDGVMWEHYIAHTLDLASLEMVIQNRIEIKQDIDVSLGYFAMLPADYGNVDRLRLNNGMEISPIINDGSDDSYDLNGCNSACFSGEREAGRSHGLAITVSSLKSSSSINTEFENDKPIRITQRTDGVAKVYWTFLKAQQAIKGTVFTCETRYSAVSGIRYPNDLRTI